MPSASSTRNSIDSGTTATKTEDVELTRCKHVHENYADDSHSTEHSQNNSLDDWTIETKQIGSKNNEQPTEFKRKRTSRRGTRTKNPLSVLRSRLSKTMFPNSSRDRSDKYKSDVLDSLSEDEEKSILDLSGFQTIEHQKTIVRTQLKFYASMLFYLALFATGLVLVDTQMTIMAREQNRLLPVERNNSSSPVSREHDRIKDKIYAYRLIGTVFRTLLSIVSICTCGALYFYYRSLFALKTIRFFYPKDMYMFRATPHLKKFMIEFCICIFHVPPFVDTLFSSSNEVQCLVFLRLYLLGRYLKERHNLMNSPATRFLASVTKTELTSMFLFKTFFMQYPFQMILLAYFILLFIGGYGVWLIEARYTYLDTVWMLIITMTTVGFGDLTPKTFTGRFAVGITAIVGIFLMALFISLVSEALMLQMREKRILSYVDTQDYSRNRKTTALNAIGMWYKYNKYIKKHSRVTDTDVLVEQGGGVSRAKKDIVSIVKAKLLETQMYRSINAWRNMKDVKGGNGYFSQEFMIEDMKIMMTGLSQQMKEMDERFDEISSNIKLILPKKPTIRSIQTTGLPVLEETDTQCHSRRNSNNNNNISKNEHNEIEHTAGFQQLLSSGNKNAGSIKQSDLEMAFNLLRNQAKIMNNALDDIYYKTRQDICDMENIINSLLICSEADQTEENNVDYVPSRDCTADDNVNA